MKINYFLLWFWLLVLSNGLQAQSTYLVKPDGTGDFPTIQEAIDAAEDDDTIDLADGTFQGDGNFNIRLGGKAITVKSHSGNIDDCIINPGIKPGESRRGFLIEDYETAETIIRDLTIFQAGALAPCPFCSGAGIFIDNNSSPTIINVSIEECVANFGGAIACENYSSPLIKNCRFINNLASSGGGFESDNKGNAIFEYCLFYNNSSNQGSAIMIEDSEVKFNNCTFVDNTGYGTVFCLWYRDISVPIGLELDNCIIGYNNSTNGVIRLMDCDPAVVDITYTDISNNLGGDWTTEIIGQLGQNGNISEDPVFVNYQQLACNLMESSPCIDAGDPLSPIDPDGTTCDMGAFYFDQTATSIFNQIGEPKPLVFPNPATDELRIRNIPGNATIYIYNQSGRLMLEQNSITTELVLDISSFNTGTYFVKVISNTQTYTLKVNVIK
jgi:hypothetical protein